jgi:hypothetical protein
LAAAESSPAGIISDFRLKQSEGRVNLHATLNRISLEQGYPMLTGIALSRRTDHDHRPVDPDQEAE